MDGRNVDGPQRATQSEARTDLERARQCKSRTEMSKYLALLAQQVRNAATNNATTTGSGNAELAAATGHERNQRRPQGSAPEVRSGPGARQSAPRATVEARAAGAGTCCTLPGLNINWPFSQLILAGVKTAEARSYDLGHHNIAHPHVEMWLVETPGDPQALAKGMALDGDARIAPRPQHAQIVGTLTFSRADRYESLESFRSERECHRIGQGGKYDWHGEGDMYAWRVSGTRRLVQPVPQPGRKGVTGFAKPRPHTVLFADGAHPAPRSSGEGAACTPAPPGGGRQQRTLTGGRSLRIVGYHGKGKGKDGKGKGKDGKGKGKNGNGKGKDGKSKGKGKDGKGMGNARVEFAGEKRKLDESDEDEEYEEPIPYVHPQGAVKWVKLNPVGRSEASLPAAPAEEPAGR